jgi:hypothetical protein
LRTSGFFFEWPKLGRVSEISDHHSSWRGAAVEQLVAATVALEGRGRINVAQTLWDGDGVDLILEGPGTERARMRIQVKSIGAENVNVVKRRRAVSLVRDATFAVREDTWVLFVLVDLGTLTFEKSWLVPSADFAARTKVNARGYRRFVDGVDSKDSMWTCYRYDSRAALASDVALRLGIS